MSWLSIFCRTITWKSANYIPSRNEQRAAVFDRAMVTVSDFVRLSRLVAEWRAIVLAEGVRVNVSASASSARFRRVAHSLTTRREPRKPYILKNRHSSVPFRLPAAHCASSQSRRCQVCWRGVCCLTQVDRPNARCFSPCGSLPTSRCTAAGSDAFNIVPCKQIGAGFERDQTSGLNCNKAIQSGSHAQSVHSRSWRSAKACISRVLAAGFRQARAQVETTSRYNAGATGRMPS